jgi:hypothetical protein
LTNLFHIENAFFLQFLDQSPHTGFWSVEDAPELSFKHPIWALREISNNLTLVLPQPRIYPENGNGIDRARSFSTAYQDETDETEAYSS